MKKLLTTTLILALAVPVMPLWAAEKKYEKNCPEDAADCAKALTNPELYGFRRFNMLQKHEDRQLYRKWLQAYMACVSFVDDQVGTVLEDRCHYPGELVGVVGIVGVQEDHDAGRIVMAEMVEAGETGAAVAGALLEDDSGAAAVGDSGGPVGGIVVDDHDPPDRWPWDVVENKRQGGLLVEGRNDDVDADGLAWCGHGLSCGRR